MSDNEAAGRLVLFVKSGCDICEELLDVYRELMEELCISHKLEMFSMDHPVGIAEAAALNAGSSFPVLIETTDRPGVSNRWRYDTEIHKAALRRRLGLDTDEDAT